MEMLVRRTVLPVLLLLALPSRALATWSVIAVDRSTGRVAIASAVNLATVGYTYSISCNEAVFYKNENRF